MDRWNVELTADFGDPGGAAEKVHAVIGFAARPADLARLRPVYAAVRAARLAWISYPNPGRPGAELHRDWLVRAFRQYGVEPVEDVWIDETWSALRLRPSPPPGRCGRFRP